jgi:hypothetical protein
MNGGSDSSRRFFGRGGETHFAAEGRLMAAEEKWSERAMWMDQAAFFSAKADCVEDATDAPLIMTEPSNGWHPLPDG